MRLFEAVIRALLWLCGIVLLFYVVLWVLGALGIMLPPNVVTILKVMLGLLALLVLARLFYPFFSSGPWFGGPGPGPQGGARF